MSDAIWHCYSAGTLDVSALWHSRELRIDPLRLIVKTNLSAKFAKMTVNHSQSEIVPVNQVGSAPAGCVITSRIHWIVVTTLDVADPERADMATLIIIGSAETRVVARASRPPLVYTPRTIESVGA